MSDLNYQTRDPIVIEQFTLAICHTFSYQEFEYVQIKAPVSHFLLYKFISIRL